MLDEAAIDVDHKRHWHTGTHPYPHLNMGKYILYTRYIPGIYQKYISIDIYIYLYIPGICLIYIRYIPDIYFDVGIYLVYTWYMPTI